MAAAPKRCYNGAFSRVIGSLAKHTTAGDRRQVPLWSVVMGLTHTGSTSAAELCVDLGHDPSVMVAEPIWLQPGQTVIWACDECEDPLACEGTGPEEGETLCEFCKGEDSKGGA